MPLSERCVLWTKRTVSKADQTTEVRHIMETQTRFRVEVKRPDETKEYLLKLDLETPEGESIDYPRLRAAQTIKLNFLVDVPLEKFREVSEAETSKMKLQPVPSSRHDTSLWEILS
jgi:hypothetical protein